MFGLKTTSSFLSTQFLSTWECFSIEVLDQSLQKIKALTGPRGSPSTQVYSQDCGQEPWGPCYVQISIGQPKHPHA